MVVGIDCLCWKGYYVLVVGGEWKESEMGNERG